MREVLWHELKPGKEYYIGMTVPNTRSSQSNSEGIPYSYKKVGKFVRISYDNTTPFAQFENLRDPPRKTESRYLPSGLGTSTDNKFSTLATRFYETAETILAEQQVGTKFNETTNTSYGNVLNHMVGTYLGGPTVKTYPGGKKLRRTKKRKLNKKRKTNKRR